MPWQPPLVSLSQTQQFQVYTFFKELFTSEALKHYTTYNEKENIVKVIDEINKLNLPIDILIVDDNPPDGTSGVVESLKNTRPNLDILHRKKKECLGSAYTMAFKQILANPQYQYIVQMEADFSHSPNNIPPKCTLILYWKLFFP